MVAAGKIGAYRTWIFQVAVTVIVSVEGVVEVEVKVVILVESKAKGWPLHLGRGCRFPFCCCNPGHYSWLEIVPSWIFLWWRWCCCCWGGMLVRCRGRLIYCSGGLVNYNRQLVNCCGWLCCCSTSCCYCLFFTCHCCCCCSCGWCCCSRRLPASLVCTALPALFPRSDGCCWGLAHQPSLNCSTHSLVLQPGCYAPCYTWMKHVLQYGCMRGALMHTGGGGVWPLADCWMTVSDHSSPCGGSVLPPAIFRWSPHRKGGAGRECWREWGRGEPPLASRVSCWRLIF